MAKSAPGRNSHAERAGRRPKPAEPPQQPSAPKRVQERAGHHRGGPGQLPGEVLQVLHPGARRSGIVGFITRGYGVSVHRADCPNADPTSASRRRRPGRWVKVSWASESCQPTTRPPWASPAKDQHGD
ncbi:MAG: hypothetical protein ACLRWQ_18175 [Flavonifractor plautii]